MLRLRSGNDNIGTPYNRERVVRVAFTITISVPESIIQQSTRLLNLKHKIVLSIFYYFRSKE